MGRENLEIDLQDALETVENEISTIDTEPDHSELLAKVYELPDEKIAEIAKEYLPLKILSATDKSGRAIVHDALMDVKGLVSKIDKVRLKTNEKAQTWIKINNGEAKRLTRLLEPIKDHLQTERDKHDAEVEAIKAEKQRLIDLKNQSRVDALLAVGSQISLAEVVLMSDATFDSYLQMATKAFNERKEQEAREASEQQAKIEAERVEKLRLEKIEAERIAKVKAEQEAEAARLKEIALAQKKQADELKAQAEAIRKAQADIEAREAKAKAEKEAEAQAKLKAEQDEKGRAAKAEQLKIETEKRKAELEKARPDSDKLLELSDRILSVDLPDMETEAGVNARIKITQKMSELSDFIEAIAKEMIGG